jgi:hypothetical protein
VLSTGSAYNERRWFWVKAGTEPRHHIPDPRPRPPSPCSLTDDSDETVVDGVANCLGAIGDVQLGVDALEVSPDRVRAEEQAVGDIGVGQTGRCQP